MAEKLRPYGFIRIHRSVVVNISAVEEIQPLPTGEYRLRVKGGKQYLVTRRTNTTSEIWLNCGSDQSGFAADRREQPVEQRLTPTSVSVFCPLLISTTTARARRRRVRKGAPFGVQTKKGYRQTKDDTLPYPREECGTHRS
jgi:hypothetical protein